MNSSNRPPVILAQSQPPIISIPDNWDRDLLLALYSNLNAFIAKQSAVNEEHSTLLEIIQNHSQLLKTHEERISKLETSNAQLIRNNNDLRREIELFKAGYRTSSDTISRSISDNITISGVPFTIRDSPQIITERVFGALGVTEIAGDVLEIRSVNKKVDSNARRASSHMGARIPTGKSFIIQLKSHGVKEYILNKKRAKKS